MEGTGDTLPADAVAGQPTRTGGSRALSCMHRYDNDSARACNHGREHGPGGHRATGPLAAARPLTRLLGRERELAHLRTLIETARLVTLTGPPGVGKTRLALD